MSDQLKTIRFTYLKSMNLTVHPEDGDHSGEYVKAESVLELVVAARKVLQMIPPLACEDFHHNEGQYHVGLNCPVEAKWMSALERLMNALAQHTRKDRSNGLATDFDSAEG